MVASKTEVFNAQLFLGFTIDDGFAQKLKKLDPAILSAYIREEDLYLQELTLSKEKYLGKYISGSIDLPSLEQLETNILSILQKLIPESFKQKQHLVLIAVPKE